MRARGGRIALALALGLALPAFARPDQAPRLTVDVLSLDFGQVDPSAPGSVLPSRVNVLVSSESAFQVSIAALPDAAAGGLPPARFAWRVPGDRFRELTPMVPFPIASGPAAGPEPFKVAFDIEPLAGWETPPGRYVSRLQFFVNGVVVADPVKMTHVVPARVDLTVATQLMDSPPINPVQPDSYQYARRVALIRSNVAWRLTAWIEGRPRRRNSAATLSASELRIASPPNAPAPLRPGVRTVVARGEATPGGPRSVAIDLWVNVSGGETAGKYEARLHFSAEPESVFP